MVFLRYNRCMQKFASDFAKNKVILRQEGMVAGEVEEVIINPENGDFLGLVIGRRGKKKKLALSEKDIIGVSNGFVLVRGAGSLGDLDEIIRIKNARDQKISIEHNRVYTLSNIFLGRVSDYSIDLVSGKLSRLYVQPWAISKIASQHIIDAKRIVSIKKNRITVEDAVVKGKKKVSLKAMPIKSECN